MEDHDLNQASEVEKDAFPELFPPTSFRRELRNRVARYLVLTRTDDHAAPTRDLPPYPGDNHTSDPSGRFFNRLMTGANQMLRRRHSSWKSGDDFIVGFVGTWHIVNEAHIVSIGVRTEYRGLGLGELLLISAVEQARLLESKLVTLEVRVSNHVAQNLYKKYGFTERGTRKGYYTDNREDALIMTTRPIGSDVYRRSLKDLIAAHERRWGPSGRTIL